MSGFVWLIFVVGMIVYSQTQAKKMKEKQRAKTAFERLEELVEASVQQGQAWAPGSGSERKMREMLARPENRKPEAPIGTSETPDATRRRIAEKKRELKRKREQKNGQRPDPQPQRAAGTEPIEKPAAAETASDERIDRTFDLRRAVIYSEILKPRFKEYE